MARFKTTAALAAFGLLSLGGTPMAQSLTAPAGREAATAPDGTGGTAGPRNLDEAIRSGDAIPVPPPAGPQVTTGAAAPVPGDAPPPPPVPRP